MGCRLDERVGLGSLLVIVRSRRVGVGRGNTLDNNKEFEFPGSVRFFFLFMHH